MESPLKSIRIESNRGGGYILYLPLIGYVGYFFKLRNGASLSRVVGM